MGWYQANKSFRLWFRHGYSSPKCPGHCSWSPDPGGQVQIYASLIQVIHHVSTQIHCPRELFVYYECRDGSGVPDESSCRLTPSIPNLLSEQFRVLKIRGYARDSALAR